MKIVGFQKTSLLDYPNNISCIIWTGGCNLNCSYCQNSGLIQDYQAVFDENEILQYLQKRKNMLDGLVISGGEPLLQFDLVDFIKKVKNIGLKVKIDTNGTFPLKLKQLIDEKLVDYVALDIKADIEEYPKVCAREFDYGKVLESLEILKNSGIEYEARTTYIRQYHKIENVKKIAQMVKGVKAYYIQNFRESEGVRNRSLSGFSEEELQAILQTAKQFNQNSYIR